MKKLTLMLTLALALFVSTSFSQTTTEYTSGVGGSKVVYVYLASMTDSLTSYYSDWIDVGDFWNDNWVTNDFSYVLYGNSANDTPYVNVSIQGRMVSGSTSSGVDVGDTIYTSGTEGTFSGLFDLGDVKFEQFRVEFDGLTNNRADAAFKVWLILNKRNWQQGR